MSDETEIRISLDHASTRGRVLVGGLFDALWQPTPGDGSRPPRRDGPRIEGDVLVVPQARAREACRALFATDDPRALAIAYTLFEEMKRRGWSPTGFRPTRRGPEGTAAA